jgi:hypothetical protein
VSGDKLLQLAAQTTAAFSRDRALPPPGPASAVHGRTQMRPLIRAHDREPVPGMQPAGSVGSGDSIESIQFAPQRSEDRNPQIPAAHQAVTSFDGHDSRPHQESPFGMPAASAYGIRGVSPAVFGLDRHGSSPAVGGHAILHTSTGFAHENGFATQLRGSGRAHQAPLMPRVAAWELPPQPGQRFYPQYPPAQPRHPQPT